MRLKQLNEGYKVLPAINKEKYQARSGLEGPFSTLSGKVVYYDPKEGSYYDPDTDMYMSYDEFQNYDKDYSGMKDERDEVTEAQIDKMKFVSKGFSNRKEAERQNDQLVGSGKASQKSYVYKHKDNKFYVVDMKDERDEVKEAGGYYTQPVYDMIKKHGYEKVMHELLTALDADVIQSFLQRAEFDESVNEADTTKYGIVRYPDTAISYIKNDGNGWEHIFDKSYGFEGPVDKDDLQYAKKIEKEKIPGRMLAAYSGGREKRKMSEAEGEVHTVYINGKKWKSFTKKETADKAAATITARGKKAEVKTGPAPQYKPRAETPMPTPKPQDPKQKSAMDKALKSIEMSFGPERKAITDQVLAMSRTAEMLTNPAWADRAWKNVDQYGIKDKADLVRELQMMIADEQRVQDDDLDGHIYGPDSNIRQMRKALDKIS